MFQQCNFYQNNTCLGVTFSLAKTSSIILTLDSFSELHTDYLWLNKGSIHTAFLIDCEYYVIVSLGMLNSAERSRYAVCHANGVFTF